MKLREVPVGMRFILLRTREVFVRVDGYAGDDVFKNPKGQPRVYKESSSLVTSLHHSCLVKPILKYKDVMK